MRASIPSASCMTSKPFDQSVSTLIPDRSQFTVRRDETDDCRNHRLWRFFHQPVTRARDYLTLDIVARAKSSGFFYLASIKGPQL